MSISGTSHSKCPGKSIGTEQAHRKPSCPSYCPSNLSPPPAQGIAPSGSNRAAQKKTKQRLFNQLIWYFGWLHSSVVSKGHSPVCHIAAGETLGLALVCFQHKSYPDCKRHLQKGLKLFAITESCSAITNTPDSAKAQFLGIMGLYWKYPNSSQVLAPSMALHSFSGTHSHISQCKTSTFLRMRDRYRSMLSEQLFKLLSLTNLWWVKDKSKAECKLLSQGPVGALGSLSTLPFIPEPPIHKNSIGHSRKWDEIKQWWIQHGVESQSWRRSKSWSKTVKETSLKKVKVEE